jgi:hypothetical protein
MDATSKFASACGWGFLTTLATYCLAILAAALNVWILVVIFAWPSLFLNSLVPLNNIGTAADPVYEGSPINLIANFAGIPLAFITYSAVIYAWLQFRGRGRST